MLTRCKADTSKIMNYVRTTSEIRENNFKAYDLMFLFLDFLTCLFVIQICLAYYHN